MSRADRTIASLALALATGAAVGTATAVALHAKAHRRKERRAPRPEPEAPETQARARQRVALHDVARELGGSTSVQQAVQQIADWAVRTTDAFGAYVERTEDPGAPSTVEVVVVAGRGGPKVGTRIPYPGSLTEEIIKSGEAQIITELGAIGESMAPYLRETCRACSGLVVPLTAAEIVLGALVLLRAPHQPHFTEAEASHVRALGDLATAAFQRLLLIEDFQESEERFRQIVENLHEVVWLGTPDLSKRYYFNPAYERVWGRSRESAYENPRSPLEAIVPEDRARVEAALHGLRHGVYDVEYRIARPDGEVRWIWSRGYPVRNVQGEVYRIVGIAEDITERKHAEEQIRTRVRQLGALSALGQYALAETGLDALFDRAVSVVAERLDVEFVELLELLPNGKELLLRAGSGWREGRVGHTTIDAGRRSMAGYTFSSDEPTIVEDLNTETRFRGSPLLVEHGAVSGLSVVIRGRRRPWGALGAHTRERRRFSGDDIFFLQSVSNILGQAIELRRSEAERTELLEREREAREESERRREALERVTESRARLMRGFSHDVKNPLGAADGFLQLLQDGLMGPLDERQLGGVERARRGIESALKLIDDLLSFARAQAGEMEVALAPTDMLALVRGVAEGYQAQAVARGLAFSIELPASLPTIESDADRVRQVLGNLLSNAVKYTEQGGITVSAREREGEGAPGPGRWIAISVADTGPGIPNEKQPLLFEEFERIEPKSGARGTGIGLFIGQQIARALGGVITVESEVGQGSTFTLWLPLRAAPA